MHEAGPSDFNPDIVPTSSSSAPSRTVMTATPPSLARPPLVLLVNEQEWSSRSLESILEPNGFAVLRAYTGRQAVELARSATPDLIILDAHMPDIEGVEVCRMLRETAVGATTPIVMTTSGPSERALRIAALRAGAWEFFSQPLDGELLLLKLSAFVRAKLEGDRLREESLLDPHTGLYSMRGLAVRIREIAADAQRRHTPLACVAFALMPESGVDLRRSDPAVEAKAAERIGSATRETGRASDAVGRLRHLEFAIIAPATPAPGAVRLAERLRERLEQIPVEFEGIPRRLTLRAGYSAVDDFADSAIDAEELLFRATAALRTIDETNGVRIRGFGE